MGEAYKLDCDICAYTENISQYKISYACPRCASVMQQEHIENNVPVHLSCPACEKGKLKATFYMDWD